MRSIRRNHKSVHHTFQPLPVCNIETAIELSPLALFAVVGALMEVLGFTAKVSGSLFKSMVVYIGGLINFERKQTALLIARRLGGVSHDNLTRLMTKRQWKCSRVVPWFIYVVQRAGNGGYLIVDDTAIQHKRSKKIKGVYWDYDHAEGRNVLCQRLVVVLWSNGYFRIPVGYALWHKKGARKKYRTKNEIARTLVKWSCRKGIRPGYIVFDGWYASKENMKLFARNRGIPFVTKLRKNCKLTYEGKKLQARTIGRRILQKRRQYVSSKTGVWSRKCIVSMGKGLGNMCFVVLKDELDGKKAGLKYLLSSCPSLSAGAVVQRYRSRWSIETFFQDIKQHMGLSQYQGRSLEGSYRHIGLCFTGAVVLDFIRRKENMSSREAKAFLCSLFFVKDSGGRSHLATYHAVSTSELQNLDKMMNVAKAQFLTGQQLYNVPLAA